MKMTQITGSKFFQITSAAMLLLGVHIASTELPRGWLSWAVSVPALIIIMLTAVSRNQDIKGDDLRSFVRRMGFILAGGGAIALTLSPILGYSNSFPSWRAVVLYWGFALTWLTTPNMPPWWNYVSGDWKIKKGQDV